MCKKKSLAEKELVFLSYLNRSGSTLLASKLAEFQEIGVGIEASFPDDWITDCFSVQNKTELDTYLNTLYRDKKFISWQVERQTLISTLGTYSFPLQFSDILYESLRLCVDGNDKRILVHKCGEFYRCVEQIRLEIPDARFVFVDRDPRAIYSSQRRSLDSRTKLPMETNIHHFLFGYLDSQRILRLLENDDSFLRVQYETLIEDEEGVMEGVKRFLGLSGEQQVGNSDYFTSVPESQKYLHKHVQTGAPQKKRIVGWKKELPVADILFMQLVLKEQLLSRGYSLYSPAKIGCMDRGLFYYKLILFHYEAMKRKVFNIPHRY